MCLCVFCMHCARWSNFIQLCFVSSRLCFHSFRLPTVPSPYVNSYETHFVAKEIFCPTILEISYFVCVSNLFSSHFFACVLCDFIYHLKNCNLLSLYLTIFADNAIVIPFISEFNSTSTCIKLTVSQDFCYEITVENVFTFLLKVPSQFTLQKEKRM